MANNPAVQQSGSPRSPSALATMAAVVAGWALIRLVAGGERQRVAVPGHTSNRRAPQTGPQRDTGFTEKEHADPHAAAQERGRGREAETPTQIPAKGWKDILWRTYEEFGKDRITSVAAGVTYYALLAVFPAIAALVSIYGLFADPASIQDHLNAMSGIMPGGAMEIIGDQVKRIASKGGGALGFGFIFGLAISLWSANAGMKAVFDALNIVNDEEEKRSFIRLNMTSLTFTLCAILFILVALAGIVVLPIVLNFVGLGEGTEWLVSLMRWPILLIGVTLGLSLIYRFGPSRDKAEWRWVTPGGIVAAVLWIAVSMLFSWYVSSFGSYNETYGSLGAVIGFMTWIWLSSIIILLGAEINAEMEHQTVHDTTEGAHQPMGVRGAKMADTVGVAKT
ncbi:YihY/virulence factor BrkB family protein [Microvirga sp. ACRRW]|uniref:YihY/virulence factor BrkB family protein n=1 Tax=Microvirga sp. ACRRW TaxID=2918205 RepID=UPI001EF6C956|nr:YihY/virulence factor BrkB family protein [Microvirga sp. ACRRW]MCG7393463.1 YihY/virulence factor BrkB family protein [Microvirga sp. ACRRW]